MRTTFICFHISPFCRTDGQGEANKAYNEEDWMELEALNAYGKSKTMAEKAAWEYVKELPGITSLLYYSVLLLSLMKILYTLSKKSNVTRKCIACFLWTEIRCYKMAFLIRCRNEFKARKSKNSKNNVYK